MSYEYIICIQNSNLLGLEELLRRQEYFETVVAHERTQIFEYRFPDNLSSMPNATVELDGHVIIFCDYGQGIDMLKNLLIELIFEYGKIEVTNDSF